MASRLLLTSARNQLFTRSSWRAASTSISPNRTRLIHQARNPTVQHVRPLLLSTRPRIPAPQSMMVLQTRQFSIGRLFVTATRVPVILVGAAAGGVAYVNHKIEGNLMLKLLGKCQSRHQANALDTEYKEKGQDLMSTVADELESLVNRAQSLGNNIHLPSFLTGLFDRTPKDSDPLAHDVQEALTSEEKAAKKIILRMHQDELSDLAQKLDDAKALLRKLDDLGDKQDHKPLDLPPIAVIGPQAYQLIHQLIGLEITTE
jgi:uncharacterized membrane protein